MRCARLLATSMRVIILLQLWIDVSRWHDGNGSLRRHQGR